MLRMSLMSRMKHGRVGEWQWRASGSSAAKGAWARRSPRAIAEAGHDAGRRRRPGRRRRALAEASDVLVDFSSPRRARSQPRTRRSAPACRSWSAPPGWRSATTAVLDSAAARDRGAPDRQHLARRHAARPPGARGGCAARDRLGHRDRRDASPDEGRRAVGHRAAAGRSGGRRARHRPRRAQRARARRHHRRARARRDRLCLACAAARVAGDHSVHPRRRATSASSLSHIAENRAIFARGAVRGRRVADRPARPAATRCRRCSAFDANGPDDFRVLPPPGRRQSPPETELEFGNTYQLLVAVVLSAQATDVGVNKATRALFARGDHAGSRWSSWARKALKEHIKTIGLFNTKAKNVIALSSMLVDEFGGEVPQTAMSSSALPGVGRKTANVVLNCAFGAGDLRGRHARLPRRQPHRPRQGQDARRGRGQAGKARAAALSAGSPPLADPARPLHLQGAPARMLALPGGRPVRLSPQDAARRRSKAGRWLDVRRRDPGPAPAALPSGVWLGALPARRPPDRASAASMPSHLVITLVATALPTTLVAVRPMSRNWSIASTSAMPSTGRPNIASVAAITTRLARGTAAMPLELIISVSRITICVPIDSSMP